MGELGEGEVRPLPIDPNIVAQLAQSTIKSVVEAAVELVTNSDDSYRRLEESGVEVDGTIDVHVIREKGGACRLLEVADRAEGMDSAALEKAVTFAAQSSGFFQGRSVRGLFGRGLKEAIIGLGSGEVHTVRNGRESAVKIFMEGGQPKYQILRKDRDALGQPPGTRVIVEVLDNKVQCPTFDVLHRQLSNHFALREIIQSPNRRVNLKLDDSGRKRKRGAGELKQIRRLSFQAPAGTLVVSRAVDVPELGQVAVSIYESDEKLDFKPFDPGSVAGIVVKTEGAVVDSRLFGYENDEASHYFFGTVDCPEIARCVRSGDYGILDPNRSGLDWRHQRCRALDAAVKDILRPLVERKRKQLAGSVGRPVRDEYKRKLRDVCRLLNSLAQSELEDLPEWGSGGTEVTTLIIRPETGYADPNMPRTFFVYLPAAVVNGTPVVSIELVDQKGNVSVSQSSVVLVQRGKRPDLWSGKFEVLGHSYGDEALIKAAFDGLEDIAQFVVRSPGQSRRSSLAGTARGLFRDIQFDNTPEPIQRVSFTDGIIKVYVRFPALSRYISASGEGIDSEKGSLMLAELVAEAFSREVSRRRLETVAPPIPGNEIDNYVSEVNQLLCKHLEAIHSALVV